MSFNFVRTAVSITLLMLGSHLILHRARAKKAAKVPGLLPPLGSSHGAGFNIAGSGLASGPGQLVFSGPIHCCGQAFIEMLQALGRLLLSWILAQPGRGKDPSSYQIYTILSIRLS